MARIRKKKKRTQPPVPEDPTRKGPPRSFVWAHGRQRALLKELQNDLRRVMEPHTGMKLRVSRSNVLKDFVHVAGPLHVSHFVILTGTDKASYIRLCKVPRGPTAVLRIRSYSLIRDVQASLQRPRMPPAAFMHPPLVVLSGFGSQQHLKLTAVLFQNMFPAINVNTAQLGQCQRVVLLACDQETEMISLRQFCISVTPSGLTKGVKALTQRNRVPDLSGFADIADFIEKGGYASESEGEDAAASRVSLSQTSSGAHPAQRTSRIRLHEVGPRLELELVKVEDGLAEGRVLYHRYESRSKEAVAAKEVARAEAERLRAARRHEQEANVRRKAAEQARVEKAKQDAQEARARKRVANVSGEQTGRLPKRAKGSKLAWWERQEQTMAGGKEDLDTQYYVDAVGAAPPAGTLTSGSRSHASNKKSGKRFNAGR